MFIVKEVFKAIFSVTSDFLISAINIKSSNPFVFLDAICILSTVWCPELNFKGNTLFVFCVWPVILKKAENVLSI